MTIRKNSLLLGAAFAALIVPVAASAQTLLVDGLDGAQGSTIGPDGALYVTEGIAGRVSRVDPWTGDVTTYWEGLPARLPMVPIGGVVDVAFLDGVAYGLVTMVGSDLGGSDTVGIYRMDGPDDWTVIADIGAFSMDNPPDTDFFIPTGVQYAMETYRGGFLVTDGHHNRVLWVSLDGDIWEFNTFDNVVPTGLEVHGKTVYVAELGPAPNDPEDGKVIAFEPKSLTPWEVVTGVRMTVDVESGLGRTLYALGQGEWNGEYQGSPAIEDDGSLVEINADGSYTEVASGLNQPTSVEFIGNNAYIVSLAGEIWVVENVASPPYGRRGRNDR